MNQEIQNKVDELVALVRAKSPANAVSFSLFVNYSEYEAEYRYRNAEILKAEGVSMRALGGDFIRVNAEFSGRPHHERAETQCKQTTQ